MLATGPLSVTTKAGGRLPENWRKVAAKLASQLARALITFSYGPRWSVTALA